MAQTQISNNPMNPQGIDEAAKDILFRNARTHNTWIEKDIDEAVLHELFDLLKMAPTSANCSPARFIFLKSEAAKERLRPFLMKGNVDKTMSAPVCAIIAQDMKFYDKLPQLFPHTDARSWFAGNDKMIQDTAFRNASLQGAYLIMAARSLGLDCGPMSGFDAAGTKEEFFPGEDIDVNFLCNLGYGDASVLHPRSPRFNFGEACKIL